MELKILSTTTPFPDVSNASSNPNGLLAAGADLSIPRLIAAYQHGIFPWFMEDQPILWWSPDPRSVLFLDDFKISRSLKKTLRHEKFVVTIDHAFQKVIKACAAPRPNQNETWITNSMQTAYCQLHEAGYAHSVEVWKDGELVGGLYGVDCGRIFTGESMFNVHPNAAKVALVYLVSHLLLYDYYLIDCQLDNPFLKQFGTTNLPRQDFIKLLKKGLKEQPSQAWGTENRFLSRFFG